MRVPDILEVVHIKFPKAGTTLSTGNPSPLGLDRILYGLGELGS